MKLIASAVFSVLLISSIEGTVAQTNDGSQDLRILAKTSSPEVKSSGTADTSSGKLSAGESGEAQGYYDSGEAFFRSGRLDEAIKALKEADRLRPKDSKTHYMLGMVYSKAKNYKESFESFKRAARFKSDWPEAQFRLGVVSYVLGKRSQAIDSYKDLLRLGSPLANSLHRIIENDNQGLIAESLAADWRAKSPEPPAAPAKEISVKNTDVQPPATKGNGSMTPTRTNSATSSEGEVLSQIYRVGVGDVLDIRLLNSASIRSTLYTVVDGGLIDFPIAGGPIAVSGLTAEEIQSRIAAELKRRAVEEGSHVSVGVRQYASHSVMITGMVGNPGPKFLRREAVPLYVIMAEAQMRLDAGRVMIMRSGGVAQTIDLKDPLALNFLVRPGDLISVTSRPQEFYYIAGRINYPGQKPFQPGITLLQAILAAGGLVRSNDGTVELSREGRDGRLITITFRTKEIKAGKIQDPRLQPGDRIEVGH